ncbi:putative ferric-chelate reductase 1 [Hyperolius riggenbachi]|uniref:putative ferric-chelate reductase 1 n=1 Tax=Hyperolius riggenbachi TaxID=752182 RepID=UPI0035A341BB
MQCERRNIPQEAPERQQEGALCLIGAFSYQRHRPRQESTNLPVTASRTAEMTGVAVVLLCLLICITAPANCYPDGLVTVVCGSMIPQHGSQPETEIIHTLTVDKTTFIPGDLIKVSLSGNGFFGFFIQARDADNLDAGAVGSFSLVDDQMSQLLTCNRLLNSAVSHTNKESKTLVEVYWIVPSNAPTRVQFLATVVETYAIYWVKIPGPVIIQTDALPVPLIPVTPSPISLDFNPALTGRFNLSGCGSRKFCIRNPADCDPKRDVQCFFLSFTTQGSSVQIEMSGPGKGYVAFALSHDQWMGDDDAYLCVIDGQTVAVSPAYTTGRSPPKVSLPDILQDIAWRVADGVIQCSFRRKIWIPTTVERYPLDIAYYIFLADGDAEDGAIKRHNRQPLITSKMYDVSGPPKDIGGSRSPLLIKFHGALMFVAWMTTVSIGVLVARFFKPVWPSSRLCGEKIWFQVHRILMMTTLLLTAMAFVLPYIYRRRLSNRAGYHQYLGCIVMALAILQPVLAIFRPPPQSPRRPIFYWTHWTVGTAARIIAVAAIFLGMELDALDLPNPWDSYTMVGFVLWHVCTEILLEVHHYCLMPREPVKVPEDQIKILHPQCNNEEGHTFKKIVLTIYICGNFGFLIAFLAAINQL